MEKAAAMCMREGILQVKAISLLTDTAKYCDDDTRLQRIVPYLIVSFPTFWLTFTFKKQL